MGTPRSTVMKRQPLTEQVGDAIVEKILDERLQAGAALPSTADLSESFGVSRTVVREALAELAARGIIERSQGRESVVASPGSDQLRELLSFRVRRDKVDGRAIMEFRQSIEVQAARLAAERASTESIDDMTKAWDRLAAARGEANFYEADIDFHNSIARASGNILIELVLDSLVDLLRDVRRTSFRGRKRLGKDPHVVIEDHRRILDAIIEHDPDAAAAAMEAHIAATLRDVAAS